MIYENKLFDIAIIGSGPSGMMAAISAKQNDKSLKICILEKNSTSGMKLLLTGKGRCNLTTSKTIPEIIAAFGKNGKFLSGSLSRFSNIDLMSFFEDRGVKLKIERGDRVFPVSDKSQTVLDCLLDELRKLDINVMYNFSIKSIVKINNIFNISNGSKIIQSKKVIIATGGKSYPQTGSTGDGYVFARSLGHNIIQPIPSLAPLITNDKLLSKLAGLSLKNVDFKLLVEEKEIFKSFGEMLFTHIGISGPIVLKGSRIAFESLVLGKTVKASIDLKPRLDINTLMLRIRREIMEAPKKEYQSLLAKLLPRSLIYYAIEKTEIDKHKQSSLLSKDEIDRLIIFLKDFNFQITGVESIKKAIVTHGGIDIKEIDPKTMQSKIVPGLYFCGEIICLDGPTGGFNLQKAFCTGYVAGMFASVS